MDACGLLKLLEDGRQGGFEVGGRCDAERSLRGERCGQRAREGCGEKHFGHWHKRSIHSKNRPSLVG
jgi:hypothetical protein